MKESFRSSNFELMRIIAMIIIVAYHYTIEEGTVYQPGINVYKIFFQLYGFGGKVGVDLFFILTGYFLITQSFHLRKLIKLFFQVEFYAVFVLIIVSLFNIKILNTTQIVQLFFPLPQFNWFVRVYIILYLMVPILNTMYNNIQKKEFIYILAIGGILWFIIPEISFRKINMEFSNLVLASYLYGVGAYIRLYSIDCNPKKIILYGIAGLVLGSIILDILSSYFEFFYKRSFFFIDGTGGNSFFPLMISIGMFLYFKNLYIPYTKWINSLATTVLGIYLVHGNLLVQHYICSELFYSRVYSNSLFAPILAIFATTAIFIGCSCIDYGRQMIFKYFIHEDLYEHIEHAICNLKSKR